MKQIENAQQKAQLYEKIDKAQKNLVKFEKVIVECETEDDFEDRAFGRINYRSESSGLNLEFEGSDGFKQDLESRTAIHIVICEQYRRQMSNYIQSLQNALRQMIDVEI